MPRTITTAAQTALASGLVRTAILAEIVFASSTQHVWSGTGTLTWNGNTYQGMGYLSSISTIEESSSVEAKGITLGLEGITVDLVGDALTEVAVGKPVTVWFALFNLTTGALVADPIIMFKGQVDAPNLVAGPDTSTITLQCESRLAELQRTCERRYTHAEQTLRYPGDSGLQYVNYIVDWQSDWGMH